MKRVHLRAVIVHSDKYGASVNRLSLTLLVVADRLSQPHLELGHTESNLHQPVATFRGSNACKCVAGEGKDLLLP